MDRASWGWIFGAAIYLAVILSVSFGLYGVVEKKLRVDPVVGMTGEVAVIAPFALAARSPRGARGGKSKPVVVPT